MGDGLQVHLRLSAARHAVQEEGRRWEMEDGRWGLGAELRILNSWLLACVPFLLSPFSCLPSSVHRRRYRRQRLRLRRIQRQWFRRQNMLVGVGVALGDMRGNRHRSEEHTSELQSP